MKTTPLYKLHRTMGARFVDFSGWQIPVWFSGLNKEHMKVRESVGIFDVSHMGEIEIAGPDSENYVNYVFTNSILNLSHGQARYGFLCNKSGGVVDDVIVYKMIDGSFFICVNAGNTEKVNKWLLDNSRNYDVRISNLSDFYGQLAIQGPKSIDFLEKFFLDSDIKSIKKYHISSIVELEEKYKNQLKWSCPNGNNFLVARTGYTGEDGFELFVPNERIEEIYKNLIKNSGSNLSPCGLGARDTLRIEMGFPLYGNELSEDGSPVDSGLEKFIDMNKEAFIGKTHIEKRIKDRKFSLIGFKMRNKIIPRSGYKILNKDKLIGHVTSGTFSPILKKGIGLGLVDTGSSELDQFNIEIRNKHEEAYKASYPFIQLRRRHVGS